MWAVALLALLAASVAFQELWSGWQDVQTRSFAVASLFPVVDAGGYYTCATHVGTAGIFGGAGTQVGSTHQFIGAADWCSRRVFIPSFLASLREITGWHATAVLALQAALVALSVLAVGLEAARSFGRLAGIGAAGVLWYYVAEFAVSQFATEVIGVIAGSLGIALLLAGARLNRLWVSVLGLSTLSVGLFGRAGALFVLPLLVAWGCLTYGRPVRSRLLRVAIGLTCAASAGLLFQFVILTLMGSSATNTGGNFAATLYGLASGSCDWSEAYRVHADLFARLGEPRSLS